MSRSLCNQVLAGSAAASAFFMLMWMLLFQPPSSVLAAVPEFLGKSLLLWSATALILGTALQTIFEIRDLIRPRRALVQAVPGDQLAQWVAREAGR